MMLEEDTHTHSEGTEWQVLTEPKPDAKLDKL